MRIVVVSPVAGSLLQFRGSMLQKMVEAGHDVLAVAPEEDANVRQELASRGVRYTTVPLSRTGLNPIRDLRTTLALTRVFRAWHADVILVYAAKPVIYGLIAGRLARVPLRSAMITGVGSALGGGGSLTRRSLSLLLRGLYKVALHGAHLVFFQNGDDEALFRTLGLVGDRQRIVRINGSGVDLDHYAPTPLPAPPLRFLLIGRLIADKGVREYVAAAEHVRRRRPEARFRLVGPLDVNPTAITQEEVDRWVEAGFVEYLGRTDDVRPALTDAHVYVLPSYREGMPRSVLEAMSMGRPVITTDAPGCRDTVVDGENGFLVPVGDEAALADRMLSLIDDPGSLPRMGARSRALAEERFDVREVDRVILEALGLSR
jgi:glycosyltransferase involved in cell wall biosynthesis